MCVLNKQPKRLLCACSFDKIVLLQHVPQQVHDKWFIFENQNRFHVTTLPLLTTSGNHVGDTQGIALVFSPFETGCRNRGLSLVRPIVELMQTARNRSSSGDPLRKHLASHIL
jgi:hypothetical protein